MSPSKEQIAAYADGELDGEVLRDVEAAIVADPELQAQVEAHRALRARLTAHFGQLVERPIPGRFLELLKAPPAQDNVVDFAVAVRRQKPPPAPRLHWAGPALAASLTIALVGYWISERSVHDYAEGDVATALDSQLVATQSREAPVRILLSVRDGEGRFCRGFAGEAQAGIACRDGRGWKLHKVVGGEPAQAGEYRQAGSADAEVLAAIQDLARGPALDGTEEQAAMRIGWQSK